ncbi:MAG: DUF1823 family protein [Geitlerinemataceae cyanobacterium]
MAHPTKPDPTKPDSTKPNFSDRLPSLETATIWAILEETLDDAIVNQIVWHHLGYRYDADAQTWDASAVDSAWSADYPEPPDFIASRPATVKLTRSIPKENKQLLKDKLGFKGYKVGEFGPRQTRRATMANWLLGLMETA